MSGSHFAGAVDGCECDEPDGGDGAGEFVDVYAGAVVGLDDGAADELAARHVVFDGRREELDCGLVDGAGELGVSAGAVVPVAVVGVGDVCASQQPVVVVVCVVGGGVLCGAGPEADAAVDELYCAGVWGVCVVVAVCGGVWVDVGDDEPDATGVQVAVCAGVGLSERAAGLAVGGVPAVQ